MDEAELTPDEILASLQTQHDAMYSEAQVSFRRRTEAMQRVEAWAREAQTNGGVLEEHGETMSSMLIDAIAAQREAMRGLRHCKALKAAMQQVQAHATEVVEV